MCKKQKQLETQEVSEIQEMHELQIYDLYRNVGSGGNIENISIL